jgi:hypothetical protein
MRGPSAGVLAACTLATSTVRELSVAQPAMRNALDRTTIGTAALIMKVTSFEF